MTDVTRKLTYVSPTDLKPNPANPRKHSRTQIRVLSKSIHAFGFNAPILVDRHIQRWQKISGAEARLHLNGKPFQAVRAERAAP